MWAYFDTSALAKRYVAEAGRRDVLQLLRRHEVATSAILPVELRSALRKRVAEGALDDRRVRQILGRVATEREYWTLIAVTGDVLAAAEMLVAAHPIRALDAVHVASAQIFRKRLSIADFLFVSADRRQADAAGAVGMAVRHLA